MFVAQAQLVGVANGPIRESNKGWIAHGRDGHVDVAAHEERHHQQDTHQAPERGINHGA